MEIWFGIMSRKVLRGASLIAVSELKDAVEEYIAADNKAAKPFMWKSVKLLEARSNILLLTYAIKH